MRRLRRLALMVALAALVFFGVAWPAVAYTPQTLTCEPGARCPPAPADLSAVPETVIEAARKLGRELFGENRERYENFVNQALSLYLEARDRDVVVIFNAGGWGWSSVDKAPGWKTIFAGMESELVTLSYSTLTLDHLRTDRGWLSYLNELAQMINGYPDKARDLAYRVRFLVDNIPGLKVILAGESNGTIITDSAMDILRNEPAVFSIQTGRPFWHQNAMTGRTLSITDNGVTPDSFSQGDVLTMVSNNLRAVFGFAEPVQYGTVFYVIRAPGHDYRWQYPRVSFEVTHFLKTNFGPKYH